MFNVFSDEHYQCMIDKFINSPQHTIDAAREIRNYYKHLIGAVLYKKLPVRFRDYIMNDDNQIALCALAQGSNLFMDCSSTLKCIFSEVKPNNVVVKCATKKNDWFNDFYKCAWREARNIKQMYSLVGKQDSKYTEDEWRKLRKALLFLKILINTSLRSRIPTMLSREEYASLVDCCNEQIAEKRYRFDSRVDGYVRVGGFNNRLSKNKAFNCFGGNGAIMLTKKAIARCEKRVNALH